MAIAQESSSFLYPTFSSACFRSASVQFEANLFKSLQVFIVIVAKLILFTGLREECNRMLNFRRCKIIFQCITFQDLRLDASPDRLSTILSSNEQGAWTATRVGGFLDDLAVIRDVFGG